MPTASTKLPKGRSCGDCAFFPMCRARFHRLAEDRDCEHAPSIFRPAAVRRPIVALGPAPRNERVIRFHPITLQKSGPGQEARRRKEANRKRRVAEKKAAALEARN